MLSRSSALILSLTSLSAGVLLGVVLARGGPTVSAQVARPLRPEVKATAVPAAPAAARPEDDAIYDALARQYESFRQVDRTFEMVAKAVAPTVVHIIAKKTIRGEEGRRNRHFEETGSGVIVRSERGAGLYVLTNHHVVENTRPASITIFLRDGRSLLPSKIWSDQKADIAVLKLDREDLPAARMGNSDDAPVGSWVMALGSPFGLTHSVSQGIISARSRRMEELQDVEYQDFLQTDAAINPGNSGGPLVNMKGEVIGINNSIASNGGGNEGVGFSIPINLARWIMNELIAHGRVNRGALGVDLENNFKPEDAIKLGMVHPRGALISMVHQSSPAAKAGLREGDIVIRFGGVEIADLNHLINIVSMAPIGQTAEVVVWRDRKEQTFRVTVAERRRTLELAGNTPEAEKDPSGLLRRPNRPANSPSRAMGLELATVTAELAARMELPDSWRGVALVVQVDPESPLAQTVRPRDIITSIDNQAIHSAEQAAAILSQRGDHGHLTVNISRQVNGQIETHTIRLP
ncbi:MAG: trypsin-like peptidase domain-containing protein [Isosphaeraceae bacterium]